jgi:integrase/recombinase XerD
MTALRQKMIDDMQLRGFAERTQEAYLSAVRQLAKHYHKPPDQIDEEEPFFGNLRETATYGGQAKSL